jgi:hypothetical protein
MAYLKNVLRVQFYEGVILCKRTKFQTFYSTPSVPELLGVPQCLRYNWNKKVPKRKGS